MLPNATGTLPVALPPRLAGEMQWVMCSARAVSVAGEWSGRAWYRSLLAVDLREME